MGASAFLGDKMNCVCVCVSVSDGSRARRPPIGSNGAEPSQVALIDISASSSGPEKLANWSESFLKLVGRAHTQQVSRPDDFLLII